MKGKKASRGKGGNLTEGLSSHEKAGKVKGMYPPSKGKQRMPKGHDRA